MCNRIGGGTTSRDSGLSSGGTKFAERQNYVEEEYVAKPTKRIYTSVVPESAATDACERGIVARVNGEDVGMMVTPRRAAAPVRNTGFLSAVHLWAGIWRRKHVGRAAGMRVRVSVHLRRPVMF